ncbi:fructosamine kinase family protein [Vibrio sp.]|uniref:fructosamine kinase family protein n=1 Tax=Vibrio sp. TaxID=678 RepID=UPI003D14AAED
MWQAIAQQLSETLSIHYRIVEKEKLPGGELHNCYVISNGIERYFVKINQRDFIHHYELEAQNLKLLAESDSITVPVPRLVGTTKNHAFIILNYLPTKPLDNPEQSYLFGQQLAKLHQWGEQKEYGFDVENHLGTLIQPNPWHKKWALFFAEQRIGWQLQLLKEKGIDLVDIDQFVGLIKYKIGAHTPKPSLLHGALWTTNVAQSVTGPISYDPACYWGDRECDLAATELFGGFQPEFYLGYESIYPLDAHYAERKNIYNLYLLLSYCNHFGGKYLAQADHLIKNLLAD